MRLSAQPVASGIGSPKIARMRKVALPGARHVAFFAIAVVIAGLCVVASPSHVSASDPCLGQPNSLTAGTSVSPGTWLCSVEDGNQAYGLIFQVDCNLALYTARGYKALWSSGTYGRTCNSSNSCLAMQGDGNLVIYYPNGCGNQPAIWTSGTGGHSSAAYCVVVQSDGNVVIYSPGSPCSSGGSPLWGTGTQSPNTRPIEGADSWRTAIVEGRNTCPAPCKSTVVNFRAIDRYSSRQPGWNPAIPNAVTAWNQSPTAYSFTPITNDTYNYIYATYPGDTTYANCGSFLTPGHTGVTINYDQFGNPSSTYQAMTIYWTDVCMNQNVLPSSGGTPVQNSTAHELGHTVGLAHNVRDATSIMYPFQTSVLGPNSNDTGAPSPGCPTQGNGYGGLGGGSMCIYGWGD